MIIRKILIIRDEIFSHEHHYVSAESEKNSELSSNVNCDAIERIAFEQTLHEIQNSSSLRGYIWLELKKKAFFHIFFELVFKLA